VKDKTYDTKRKTRSSTVWCNVDNGFILNRVVLGVIIYYIYL
jgi:hypothetical protein